MDERDVMLGVNGWLTPGEVAGALHETWTTHEERDLDSAAPPPPPRSAMRAAQARRTADARAGVRLLREAAPADRRGLAALLLSPSLDLRNQDALRFATAVFEHVSAAELTPASLVRGVEAAARAGREDLVARSRESDRPTFERAALVLELVADRLERSGELTAARLARVGSERA
jgi:hypothetical protein